MGDLGFKEIVLRKRPKATAKEIRKGLVRILENELPNAGVLGHGSNENAAWKNAAEFTVESSRERTAMSWECG